MRTIPYMCLACGEIADVAVPIGETGPGECPMCGGELTCDFDLPVNEHIRVEVQTPERLRFSFPYDLTPLSNIEKCFWIGFINLPPLSALFSFISILVWSDEPPPSTSDLLSRVISLTGWFIFFTTALSAEWYGRKAIELNHDGLAIRSMFGCFSSTRRVPSTKIENVIYELRTPRLKTTLQEGGESEGTCYLLKRRRKVEDLTTPGSRKIARYVTQLIRRQLTTMGHELQDG